MQPDRWFGNWFGGWFGDWFGRGAELLPSLEAIPKHIIVCSRCGFKYRRQDVDKDRSGDYVCLDKCWEPEHPQDRVRIRPTKSVPQIRRSEPAPDFRTTTVRPEDL